MRVVKALLWLHALRTRRYLLSLASGALTDALWMSIFLVGALASRGPGYAREVYWALVAWAVIANASWMIGGWVAHLSELGLLEPLEVAGVSPVAVAAARSFAMALPTAISSLLTMALSYAAGADPLSGIDLAAVAALLALLWAQSTAYGAMLAAAALVTGVPAALLDIATLTYLGLLLVPCAPELLLAPLLGPGYALRLVAAGRWSWSLAALPIPATLATIAAALACSRWAMRRVRERGFKAMATQ